MSSQVQRDALKPCPFCGVGYVLLPAGKHVDPETEHEDWCPLFGRGPFLCTIENWNRRFPDETPAPAGPMEWWRCQCGAWFKVGDAVGVDKHMKETGHTSMAGPASAPPEKPAQEPVNGVEKCG